MQFSLTSAMIDHLKLIQDDEHLGKALVALFHHKIDGHEFIDCADKCTDMRFIIALLNDDLQRAAQTNLRQKKSRDGSVTVTQLSQTSLSPSEKERNEKEISPHTPYIEKENKEKENSPSLSTQACECVSIGKLLNLFQEFYMEYPRKVARGDAQKAFITAMKNCRDPEAETKKWIEAIRIQRDSFDFRKDGGKYIPYPATWIRACRWTDEIHSESVNETEAKSIELDNKASAILKGINL